MEATLYIDLPKTHYRPGEILRGEILWALDKAPDKLELTLGWWTEGRGNKDSEIKYRQEWQSPRAAGKESIEIKLPDTPYSFEGHLISLKWALELRTNKGSQATVFDIQLTPSEAKISLPFVANESKRKSFSFGSHR